MTFRSTEFRKKVNFLNTVKFMDLKYLCFSLGRQGFSEICVLTVMRKREIKKHHTRENVVFLGIFYKIPQSPLPYFPFTLLVTLYSPSRYARNH